ncbi:MAG: DUF938 domain-containing protein [Deltaproteobacteria bacterium]|nr:MAG: DUF938 domain-containing protein [Deltaproteobacteria bacterium]
MKRQWPAPLRNRDPILDVLRRVLPGPAPQDRLVLEIAAGTGQHAVYFAAALPWLRWLPTDPDPAAVASIAAWRDEAGLANLLDPVALDVTQPWPVDAADAVYCCNMLHIAPWPCTLALLDGARSVLPTGAPLVVYGPFQRGGRHTAPSNAAFDRSLRERDPRWGVRDLDVVAAEARSRGLALDEVVPMPANNLTVVFRRT